VVTGKLVPLLTPATYALELESSAMARAESLAVLPSIVV
jgi:hypothetical protein